MSDKIDEREIAVKHLKKAMEALKWQQVDIAKNDIAMAGIAVARYELALRQQS